MLKWTEKLCVALEQDYRNYALRTCMDNQEKVSSEYMQENKRDWTRQWWHEIFYRERRKYYKVCMLWRGTQDDVSVLNLLIEVMAMCIRQQGGRNQQNMSDSEWVMIMIEQDYIISVSGQADTSTWGNFATASKYLKTK